MNVERRPGARAQNGISPALYCQRDNSPDGCVRQGCLHTAARSGSRNYMNIWIDDPMSPRVLIQEAGNRGMRPGAGWSRGG